MNNEVNKREIYEQAIAWRRRLTSQDKDKMVEMQFQDWLDQSELHEEIYGRAVTMWEAFGQIDEKTLETNVDGHSSAHVSPLPQANTLRYVPWYGIAATIVIAIVLLSVMLMPNQMDPQQASLNHELKVYSSDKGQLDIVLLSDGTEVVLGADSQISVSFSEAERSVRLNAGEAFFDVEKDIRRPFIVSAGHMKIEVLGTEFDVTTFEDQQSVAVAEGYVEVSFPYMLRSKPTSLVSRKKLKPGQTISAGLDTGLRKVSIVAARDIGAWRGGRLMYDGVPLTKVLADLNRYSKRPIEFLGEKNMLETMKLRGGFKVENLEETLSSIALIHKLSVDISNPEKIIIQPK